MPKAFTHPQLLANLWIRMEKQGLAHLAFCPVGLQPQIELGKMKTLCAAEVVETDNYKLGTHMEIRGDIVGPTNFKLHYSEWKCSRLLLLLDPLHLKISRRC